MFKDIYGFNVYSIKDKSWKIKLTKQYEDEVLLIIESSNGDKLNSFSISSNLFLYVINGIIHILKVSNELKSNLTLERIVTDSSNYRYNLKYDGSQLNLSYEEYGNETIKNFIININKENKELFLSFFEDVLRCETFF